MGGGHDLKNDNQTLAEAPTSFFPQRMLIGSVFRSIFRMDHQEYFILHISAVQLPSKVTTKCPLIEIFTFINQRGHVAAPLICLTANDAGGSIQSMVTQRQTVLGWKLEADTHIDPQSYKGDCPRAKNTFM